MDAENLSILEFALLLTAVCSYSLSLVRPPNTANPLVMVLLDAYPIPPPCHPPTDTSLTFPFTPRLPFGRSSSRVEPSGRAAEAGVMARPSFPCAPCVSPGLASPHHHAAAAAAAAPRCAQFDSRRGGVNFVGQRNVAPARLGVSVCCVVSDVCL